MLVFLIYVRPQEFWPPLAGIPFLYAFLFLSIYGQILDLKLRISKPMATPQLVPAILFFIWCLITMALWEVKNFVPEAILLTIALVLYFTPAHAVQSFRTFHLLAGTLIAIGIFLSIVGIHQAHSDWGCVFLDPPQPQNNAVGTPDGRPCQAAWQCYLGEPEPGADYVCERVGLFGTTSVNGRVRYRGVLQDPNELSLTLAIIVPFAFAFYEYKKTLKRLLLVILTLGITGAAVYYSRSRGGQLVLAATLGVYFVRRYKIRGAILGMILAMGLLAVSGRSGSEADKSTLERLEAWYEGMNMFRTSPFFGVGMTQFVEHHWLTAHNAYLLAASETGIIGLFLWMLVLYVSVKIPVMVVWRYRNDPNARIARCWGWAMLANWAGTVIGIALLSFTYHFVLWLNFGVTGALYSTVRAHDPTFKVRLRLWDVFAIAGAAVGLCFALYAYTRWKAPK